MESKEEDTPTTPSSLRGSQQQTMSEGSAASSSAGSASIRSPSVRANLTRQHQGSDPLFYYDVLQVLGTGSMGTVAKVRKKPSVVGFSARHNVQERQKVLDRVNTCFSLPLVGGIFAHCFRGHTDALLEKASRHDVSSSSDTWVLDVSSGSSTSKTTPSSNNNDLVFAMKSIHLHAIKDQTFVDELKNEIELLKTLDHPHIVRVIETFDYHDKISVVMELCSGGDLYARDPYTEEEAARICSSILSAVSYMHGKGIIHRDLKYENILFVDDSPHAEIKLIDFGLSKECAEHGEVLTDGVGTIYTMAPEVLQGSYTMQADLWSVGVVAYMLMSSQMPFYGRTRHMVMERILNGKYDFVGRRWKRVSKQGKAFVEDLLVMDPDDRATADEALRLSWLNRRHEASVRDPHEGELENVKRSINRFVTYPKLRKVALLIVAHRSTSTQIGRLRKVFQHYDTNNAGTLNYDKFKAALHDVGYSDEDYQGIFDAVDIDGSGEIRYTEYLAATIEAAGWISEERLAEAFDRVDHENTGFITKANLQYLLGEEYPDAAIDEIMQEAASDNGEGISYADFMAQWNDDKDEFEREWHKHMIQEVIVDRALHDVDSTGDISMLSESAYEDTDSDTVARVLNFSEGKMLSERKYLDLSPAPKTPVKRESQRKVKFQEEWEEFLPT